MKAYLLIALLLLSGCSWFHRKPLAPDTTELIVTGAPVGSFLVIDGTPLGPSTDPVARTQVVRVAAGMHVLEVKVSDFVTYRENIYVAVGEKRVISVLSGAATQ